MPSRAPNPHNAPLLLLYACTAVIVLVLVAMNIGVIVHLRDSELRREEEQLKNLSLTLAEQANRALLAVDLVVSSVARAAVVTDAPSFADSMAGRDIHLQLREKISGVPQLAAVTLIGADGKVVNSSRGWPAPEIDVSDRDYFRVLKDDPATASYVSAPAWNHGTGAWTVFLARRVSGGNGELLGIILGAIEVEYFNEFYQAISLSKDSTIALQRLDGIMLARFPPTDALGKRFSSAQRLLRDGVSGTLREPSPIDGLMRLKAAYRLTDFPVLVVTTKTEEAALANWRSMTQQMVLAALAGAVSITLAAFAFGQQLKQQAALAHAQAELRRQTDLTEALEAMRSAKEAAEAADRAKSAFLATMSHELRTPLNAILGFSEIMLREIFGPLGNHRYIGYAQDINSSGNHLLAIVNDVLDLSKAASGKLELADEWIDASEVVHSACRLIQPRIVEAGLSLSVKTPSDGVIVKADRRLLKQILLNLLSNAYKFTPRDGRIECSVSSDGAGVRFAVADTGIGIPAAYHDQVMLPFVQVESSLSRRHSGTGLGLALVRAMAELHGGSLHLDSEAGRGTTVVVIFPPDRLKSENGNPSSEDAASFRAMEQRAAR